MKIVIRRIFQAEVSLEEFSGSDFVLEDTSFCDEEGEALDFFFFFLAPAFFDADVLFFFFRRYGCFGSGSGGSGSASRSVNSWPRVNPNPDIS